jgi:phosphoribosyl 1,2-cyclic phosphodiesterase
MKFCTLGSGSSGNVTWVGNDQEAVLLDVGKSAKAILKGMLIQGLDPQNLKGLFVSHEHSDHYQGAAKLSRDLNIPVYSGRGTYEALEKKWPRDLNFKEVHEGEEFKFGKLLVKAHGLIHDVVEPYCFSVTEEDKTMAVVTDLGSCDERTEALVSRVDALIFEANYDENMLANSPYPQSLKQRISGGEGHLANSISGKFLAEHLDPKCQLLLLAHLSENANSPHMALSTMRHFLLPKLKAGLNMGIAPRYQSSGVVRVLSAEEILAQEHLEQSA